MSEVDDLRSAAALLRQRAQGIRDETTRGATLAALYAAEQRDLALAEVKRLRVQLGCVKALATLWEETAAQMEPYVVETLDRFERASLITRVSVNRSHADALREMLGDD